MGPHATVYIIIGFVPHPSTHPPRLPREGRQGVTPQNLLRSALAVGGQFTHIRLETARRHEAPRHPIPSRTSTTTCPTKLDSSHINSSRAFTIRHS